MNNTNVTEAFSTFVGRRVDDYASYLVGLVEGEVTVYGYEELHRQAYNAIEENVKYFIWGLKLSHKKYTPKRAA